MVSKGDRITLLEMPDDPNPIPPGTKGTIQHVEVIKEGNKTLWYQIDVDWDNGRKLALTVPPDRVEVEQ